MLRHARDWHSITGARSRTSLTGMLLVFVTLTWSSVAKGQNNLGSERGDANNFRGDIWSVLSSPARMQSRDAATAAGILATAAVASRLDSATYHWLRHHDRTFMVGLLSPIRDSARFSMYEFGSGQYLLPFSAVLYVAGRLSKSSNLRDAGIGCAAGHIASLSIRQVVFRSVARARPAVTPNPYEFSVPGSPEWSKESFYSGHISNSMACASFMSNRFSLGIAEPLPYIFSTGIGIGRLADGHHWASDFLLGGAIGYSVGKTIADRQLGRRVAPVAPGAVRVQRTELRIPVAQWSITF